MTPNPVVPWWAVLTALREAGGSLVAAFATYTEAAAFARTNGWRIITAVTVEPWNGYA